MTPEEFKQRYVTAQERLGNHLQAITDLHEEINGLIEQINHDYAQLNEAAAEFFRSQGLLDSTSPPN